MYVFDVIKDNSFKRIQLHNFDGIFDVLLKYSDNLEITYYFFKLMGLVLNSQ